MPPDQSVPVAASYWARQTRRPLTREDGQKPGRALAMQVPYRGVKRLGHVRPAALRPRPSELSPHGTALAASRAVVSHASSGGARNVLLRWRPADASIDPRAGS